MRNRATWLAALVVGLVLSGTAPAADPPGFELETIRGHVVYLHAAIEKKYGISSAPEARERMLALQTADGSLIPLIEDVRGRAFRVDERLRKLDLELVVRRYEGLPGIQVLRVFEVAKEGLLELDYWCDVCSISMVEQKPCECCQAETVLRRTKVEEGKNDQ
jgi:hypothetical protein